MEAYELWRSLMYCVGVFVTCNAGGAGLRWAASALTRRREDAPSDERRKRHPFDDLPVDEMALYSDIENAANADAPPKRKQSFADMMREVDAHKGDYPPEADETDGGPAPDAERLTPEELAAAYQRSCHQIDAAPDAPSETDAA